MRCPAVRGSASSLFKGVVTVRISALRALREVARAAALGSLLVAGIPAQALAGSEAVGATFTQGGVVYTVTNASAGSESVTVTSITTGATGAVEVPAQVASPAGAQYAVTAIRYNAVAANGALTSLSLPAGAACPAGYLSNLHQCPALERITVAAGNPSFSSIDGVLFNADATSLIAFPRAKGATSYEVPGSVHTVYNNAFAGNTTLRQVTLPADLTGGNAQGAVSTVTAGGIGASAFRGCTALKTVSFAEGCVISLRSGTNTAAVGTGAFADCSSLERIVVPPVLSACRKGDYYQDNATERGEFVSGYMPYWHNGEGPVYRPALGTDAFARCTALKTVVFEAGNEEGMYAYYLSGGSAFYQCTSLESVVFEGAQAYWSNPATSRQNQTYSDCWEGAGISAPQLYYAVDYYVTEAAAQGDDAYASGRLARVEYRAGTAVAALAANDQATLASAACDRALYAQTPQDGDLSALDPNEVAHANGLSGNDWCWHLGGNQYERSGLSDSCCAYLVRASDLSQGFITSTQTDAMRLLTDRHLDVEFNPERYYNDTYSHYGESFQEDGTFLGEAGACWFTLDSAGVHLDGLQVRAADGSVLPEDAYTLSLQCYDAATGTVGELGEDMVTAPYLLTVTPKAESGYAASATVSQWVLVRAHFGEVPQYYGPDASYTSYYANHAYDLVNGLKYGAPYAVMVGAGDATSALIAAGFAGLVQGGVQVSASASSLGKNALRGMLSGVDDKQVLVVGNLDAVSSELEQSLSYTTYRFGQASADGSAYTAAELAARSYQAFNRSRETYLGADEDAYQWGGAAVVCSTDALNDVSALAAYAYAKRAPVFFAEADGTLSAATVQCLGDFSQVVLVGGESVFSTAAEQAIARQLGGGCTLTRLAGDEGDACGLSIEVARQLLADAGTGTGYADVSIVDGRTVEDVVASLGYAGFKRGLTLVSTSTADSKRIVAFLRSHRDAIDQICLFGRDASCLSSTSFDLEGMLTSELWTEGLDSAIAAACKVTAGDTLCLHGMQFQVGQGNTLTMTGVSLGGLWPFSVGSRYAYDGATYTVGKVVSVQVPLSALHVLLDASYPFTGGPVTPVPRMVYAGRELQLGTDFTVAYENNATLGTARLTITGQGSYTGTLTREFAIVAGDLSQATVTEGQATYTGKKLAVNPQVKLGATVLTAGVDYTLSKSSVTNAGSYRVTVTGKGYYTGSITYTKVVAKARQSVRAKTTRATLRLAKLKKRAQSFKVGARGAKTTVTFSLVKGSPGKKCKRYVKLGKAGKVTFKKGAPKGTYRLKVRLRAAKGENYQLASKTVTVVVKIR